MTDAADNGLGAGRALADDTYLRRISIDEHGGIALWLVDLDAPGACTGIASLVPGERERASRLHHERDRRRWIAGRLALRRLLSAHTGIPAHELVLLEGPRGKPRLAAPSGPQFNLSHSDGLALIAIGADEPLGVDLEVLRPVPDAMTLAQRYFVSNERDALAALLATARERAFLVCWTRKEACMKATGRGLALHPQWFEVGIDESPRTVELPPESVEAATGSRLALHSFAIDDRAIAAIARVLR